MWFLTVIWKSIHTIQFKLGICTCCVSVHNWFAFGPCWSNFCPLLAKKLTKLGENFHFQPSPAKFSTQSNWFLVSMDIWWVFRNDSIFFCIVLIYPLWWPALYFLWSCDAVTHMIQGRFNFIFIIFKVHWLWVKSNVNDYDIIKWKQFPNYWHFVRGIHWSRSIYW